ncbi:MAG: tetratricopeptide repeat protein, partial [Pyrinomonadaceae bacterium]
FDDAYADIKKSLQLDPNNKAALYAKAYADWNDEADEQAKVGLTRLLQLDPYYTGAADLLRKVNDNIARAAQYRSKADLDKLYADGSAQFDKKDYKGAVSTFTSILTKDPKYNDARFQRGRAYLMLKKYAEGIADYDAYIAINPSSWGAYFNRALLKDEKGDPDGAIADYGKALGLNPTNVDLNFYRAGAFRDKKDYNSAESDYRVYLKAKPQSEGAWFNLGLTMADKSNFDEGIASFTEAIKVNPKYIEAYSQRAALYKKKKDYTSALADYDQIDKIDAKSVAGIIGRIDIFRDQKDNLKIEAEYAKYVAAQPENGRHSRGHYYLTNKIYDKAIADFAECVKITGGKNTAYFTDLRATYLEMKVYPLALENAEAELKLAPDSAFSFCYRGEVYLRMGKFDEAAADYDKAITIDPKNSTAVIGRAKVTAARGQYAQSMTEFENMSPEIKKLAYYYLERARVNIQFKKTVEAKADLTKALEISPEYQGAKDELAALNKPAPKPRPKGKR